MTEAVQFATELIRIDTTNRGGGDAAERPAAEYVAGLLAEAGLAPAVLESTPGRANVVARVSGTDPAAPALLLHGHLDVVPAEASDWSVHPFGGEIRDGVLWGRGAVDMKNADAVILAVVRAWARAGWRPRRDIVLAFTADEEDTAADGARYLVEQHADLFEGCTEAVGESGAFTFHADGGQRLYPVASAERGTAWLKLTAHGRAGHGAKPNTENAVTRLAAAITRIGEYEWPVRLIPTVRAAIDAIAEAVSGSADDLGSAGALVKGAMRNSANPTMLSAGYKVNVIPGTAVAYVDGRVLPGYADEFAVTMDELCGPDVTWEYAHSERPLEAPLDAPIVDAMKAALLAADPEAHVVPYCMTGGTDGKQFGQLGMACYGFTPLVLPAGYDYYAMFHGVDERIPLSALDSGVEIMDSFLRSALRAYALGVGRIPSGTITLLFSDIAGSTRLWETEPDAMAVALRRHDDIMRSVIEGAGGYVFKTVGDAFCAAFETAQQAVAAAARAQLDLSNQAWPTDPPVRVRIALHTGVCEERDGDYFGPTVNRVARLEAIAHGGQTVASGATAELVDDSLPEGVRLRDLGTHRLRDLGRPEHVYEIDIAGLPASFPPLESLDSPELPNNLPGLLSTFVGRSAELAAIRRQLTESRLLTLTGAGGCGKTRLALHAAAEQLDSAPDGVWLVELAALTDPGAIPAAMAAVLGLPSRSESALLAALHEQDALLVLDNCEHMIEEAAKLCDRITRDCRRVRILATSREPLGIDGERVYRVASLSLPGPDENNTSSEAVELFAERARAQDPGFVLDDVTTPLAASVCRRLDGIPLAIELAAARLKSMSLSQVSARLDQRFRLLTGGSRNVMPRQQTLQATVDWSFGLLSEPERETLRRMSVFTGGFELEAAEAVCALDAFEVLDLLGSLVDKSLVVADRNLGGSVRYRLLETIRQYCVEELLRTDGDDGVRQVRTRHAEYYLALAETAAPELTGPAQAGWLRRLDPEWENLRAAFGYFADEERTADVLRLGVALERFTATRGHIEVLYWLRAAIERADPVPDALMASALLACSSLTRLLLIKDLAARATARQMIERAHAIARSLGDRKLQARALDDLSTAAYWDHDPVTMKRLCEEATEIARQIGDLDRLASLLNTLELVPDTPFAERRRLSEQALDYYRRTGDQLAVATALYRVSDWHMLEGQLGEGRPYLDEAIAIATELGAGHFVYLLQAALCITLLIEGKVTEAAPVVRRNLRIAHRLGDGQGVATVLFCAACCASWLDPGETAARLHGAADAEIKAALADGTMVGVSDPEQELRSTSQDRLRGLLGDAAFEAAYRSGAQLTRMQAVELALGRNTQAVLKLGL